MPADLGGLWNPPFATRTRLSRNSGSPPVTRSIWHVQDSTTQFTHQTHSAINGKLTGLAWTSCSNVQVESRHVSQIFTGAHAVKRMLSFVYICWLWRIIREPGDEDGSHPKEKLLWPAVDAYRKFDSPHPNYIGVNWFTPLQVCFSEWIYFRKLRCLKGLRAFVNQFLRIVHGYRCGCPLCIGLSNGFA